MPEKLVRVALLYDFYGPLLTEKQRLFIELYYHQDFSLAEIAQRFGVTRQAVYDLLRRAQTALEEYESKLQLVQRFTQQQATLDELRQVFSQLEEHADHWLATGQVEDMQRVKAGIAATRQLLQQLVVNW